MVKVHTRLTPHAQLVLTQQSLHSTLTWSVCPHTHFSAAVPPPPPTPHPPPHTHRYREADLTAQRIADLKVAQAARLKAELVAQQRGELEHLQAAYQEVGDLPPPPPPGGRGGRKGRRGGKWKEGYIAPAGSLPGGDLGVGRGARGAGGGRSSRMRHLSPRVQEEGEGGVRGRRYQVRG
jgi:hypothetical protein